MSGHLFWSGSAMSPSAFPRAWSAVPACRDQRLAPDRCFPDISSCQKIPEEGQRTVLVCAGNLAVKHLIQLPADLECLCAGGITTLLKQCLKYIVGVHPFPSHSDNEGPERFSSARSCGFSSIPLSTLRIRKESILCSEISPGKFHIRIHRQA